MYVGMVGGVAVGVLLVAVGSAWAQLRVGGALNLFGRFGYLSISMRVVPRNDTNNSWLFREPVVDVFKEVIATRSHPGSTPSNVVFHGDFHMEFCDDLSQLLQAYFREFTVEKLDRPWEAYTGGWSEATMARSLGLNASHVRGPHAYVLVRVSRHREAARLSDTFLPLAAPIHEAVQRQADSILIGDVPAVGQFIRSFGSHYIASYVTGNSLYQVLVYDQSKYSKLKEKLQETGVASIPSSVLKDLFSPFYAEHVGLVLSASGNATLAHWAKSALTLRAYYITYPSLLKLHGNNRLLKELDSLLGNEALLQLSLRTLAPAFKDKVKRKWFQEIIDNHLKLWEVNM